MTTPQPQPPSDADRIIAAQREEGRKTRNLLLWIFIGIPALGLLAWGVVAIASASSTSSPTSSSCDTRASNGDIDLTACPLSGPLLTDASLCSAYSADDNQAPPDDQTNPAVYFDSEHQIADVAAFNDDCTRAPAETLGYTLQSEGLQP